jgi:hypothetical protein
MAWTGHLASDVGAPNLRDAEPGPTSPKVLSATGIGAVAPLTSRDSRRVCWHPAASLWRELAWRRPEAGEYHRVPTRLLPISRRVGNHARAPAVFGSARTRHRPAAGRAGPRPVHRCPGRSDAVPGPRCVRARVRPRPPFLGRPPVLVLVVGGPGDPNSNPSARARRLSRELSTVHRPGARMSSSSDCTDRLNMCSISNPAGSRPRRRPRTSRIHRSDLTTCPRAGMVRPNELACKRAPQRWRSGWEA